MSEYTRITVSGSLRRVEVVVPSTETLGAVMPGLVDLLGEPAGTVSRPLTFVGTGGEQLELDKTPQQQELPDGAVLRLVRLDAAPPPPAVIDFVDISADRRDSHPGRWDDAARHRTGQIAVALAIGIGGASLPLLPLWLSGVLAASVLLAAGLAAFAMRIDRSLAEVFIAAGVGLSVALGVSVTAIWPTPAQAAFAGGLLAISASSVTVGVGLGVGSKGRGATIGALLGLLGSSVALVLLAIGVPAVRAAEVVLVLMVFALGSLPWVALSAADITGLDDQVADGVRVPRAKALSAVDEAFAALTWSITAASALLAVAGTVAVLSADMWGMLVAATAALVAALRTRAFPLRAQSWAIWTALSVIGAATAVGLSLAGMAWIAAIGGFGIALFAALASLIPWRPHQKARLRGVGNALESVAAIATLPLLLGGLGLYAELLTLFGSGH